MNSTDPTFPAFQTAAALIGQLNEWIPRLEAGCGLLPAEPAEGREWYSLLRQKLVPQLGADSWLVVAVAGGTNIGKSIVFNHLAGCRASASSPLASGTRHPVCLVPESFTSSHRLQDVFPDFTLRDWSEASDALGECDQHQLFWRTSSELPPSLLILDTPDIDSDARVNWLRADAVRRCADVLIAVLTQQKYNDAAVKEFFRKAAVEDKAVIVIFNQCLLPEDEQYWPIWIDTFCRETGVRPESVYVTPVDRRAAEELRLPFYERPWPVPSGWNAASVPQNDLPRSLAADLSRLRFHEIRMRTLAGSLRELVHADRGVPSWLDELAAAGRSLAGTAERLSSEAVLKIRNWPSPSSSVMVEEIRSWWQSRQEGWARQVNRVYGFLGAGLLWPIRTARTVIQGPPIPPMDEYRTKEWMAILSVVEEMFEKLQWMASTGNSLIQKRIEKILKGSSRGDLIRKLKQAHDAVDFRAELSGVINHEMERFQLDSPELFSLYRQLHNVSAAVRPVTSVVLFSLGFGPAGEAVAPFVAGAAAQAVVHVVADVAGGAAVAVAGDAAVSNAAGTGAGLLQTWFHRLHAAYLARRADWLTVRIHQELLGTLPEDLKAAVSLTTGAEYCAVQNLIKELRQLISSLPEYGVSTQSVVPESAAVKSSEGGA